MVVPFPYLRGYGPNFRQYRIDDESARLSRFPQEIRSAVEKQQWRPLSQYLYEHRSEQNQLSEDDTESEHGRDIEAIGAIALRLSKVPWQQFVGFAACASVPVKTQPEFKRAKPPASCLARQSGALCPIGRGCKGRIP